MKASELIPLPRCTFVGKTPDTGVVARCARWQGHEGDHEGYKDVLLQMAEALAEVRRYDLENMQLGTFVIMAQARVWWTRLVIDSEKEDATN